MEINYLGLTVLVYVLSIMGPFYILNKIPILKSPFYAD